MDGKYFFLLPLFGLGSSFTSNGFVLASYNFLDSLLITLDLSKPLQVEAKGKGIDLLSFSPITIFIWVIVSYGK
jgi:hypothetical protein